MKLRTRSIKNLDDMDTCSRLQHTLESHSSINYFESLNLKAYSNQINYNFQRKYFLYDTLKRRSKRGVRIMNRINIYISNYPFSLCHFSHYHHMMEYHKE